VKIATWNVNGIRARLDEVFAWAAGARPDVLCLQELKATADQIPSLLCELIGYWCYWHGLKGYSGVALLVRRELSATRPAFSHPPFDHDSRIVTVQLGAITVASIYVPNGGKQDGKDLPTKLRFLEAMAGYAQAFAATGAPLVMCGDFNVARTDMDVHPRERKPGAIGQRPDERALLEGILAHGLVDVGRALDPHNAGYYTWWAPWRELRQRNVGWRLDYVFASQALAATATSCPSFREVGTSDHAPVVATFEVDFAGDRPQRDPATGLGNSPDASVATRR
jgi:exodeoxyribonuclease-3